MAEMLAAVYHGPRDLRLEAVPAPQIGAGEVLVRVSRACICGTDLRIYQGGHRKYPPGTVRIPGHEMSGIVAEIGDGVRGLQQGQRVMVAPNWGCGRCRQCVSGDNNLCAAYDGLGVTLDGAFAEYLRMPAPAVQQGNIIALRSDLDPAVAALIEPLACVLRGQRALGISPGDMVLIMGAGPIGVMHTKLARLSGAGKVIVSEPMPERLEGAKRAGADCVVNPASEDLATVVAGESQGNGADIVIVAAAAHQAQEAALRLAAIGGRINYFGGLPKDRPTIQIDSNLVHYKELRLTGTTGCSSADCMKAAEIVNAGRIELGDLISHRFPLPQVLQAFQTAEGRQALKIVIET